MITEFNLRDIIRGCIESNEFASPECRLLNRISNGEDIPEYPEINPESRYFYQLPQEDFARGPTDMFTLDEFLLQCLDEHNEYPTSIWEE